MAKSLPVKHTSPNHKNLTRVWMTVGEIQALEGLQGFTAVDTKTGLREFSPLEEMFENPDIGEFFRIVHHGLKHEGQVRGINSRTWQRMREHLPKYVSTKTEKEFAKDGRPPDTHTVLLPKSVLHFFLSLIHGKPDINPKDHKYEFVRGGVPTRSDGGGPSNADRAELESMLGYYHRGGEEGTWSAWRNSQRGGGGGNNGQQARPLTHQEQLAHYTRRLQYAPTSDEPARERLRSAIEQVKGSIRADEASAAAKAANDVRAGRSASNLTKADRSALNSFIEHLDRGGTHESWKQEEKNRGSAPDWVKNSVKAGATALGYLFGGPLGGVVTGALGQAATGSNGESIAKDAISKIGSPLSLLTGGIMGGPAGLLSVPAAYYMSKNWDKRKMVGAPKAKSLNSYNDEQDKFSQFGGHTKKPEREEHKVVPSHLTHRRAANPAWYEYPGWDDTQFGKMDYYS